MPLLRDYIAEHERAMNLGGDAVRALDRADFVQARELLSAMGDELRSHWRGEEQGLFAVMAVVDELYADHIRPLVGEHRELDELLDAVDLREAADREHVRQAIEDLHEHIAKEEDGVFPASLTALDGEQWDAAMAGWRQAHPGQRMIDTS